MEPFRSIVVDVDAAARSHPALEWAVRLAGGDVAITITDVIATPLGSVGLTAPHVAPGLPESAVEAHRQRLARIAAGVPDAQVEWKLLTGRPATAVIREILRSHHDLLIRSHARQLTSAAKPFGAVDMELMRKCPCPVLVVRHARTHPTPRVAAAIDAATADPEEQALNGKILDIAAFLARRLGAMPITALQAVQPFAAELVRSHADGTQFARYVETAHQSAATAMAALVDAARRRGVEVRIALRPGPPDDVIPDFVISEGVDLVVMGTVARSGLPGILLGNTAERVLRKLPCSVLTVKPDGFVSPVRLR